MFAEYSCAEVVPVLPVPPVKVRAVIVPLEFWLILPAEASVTVPAVASAETAPFKVISPDVLVVKLTLVPDTEPVPPTVKAPVLVMLASPSLLVVTAPVTFRPVLTLSTKVKYAPVPCVLNAPRLAMALALPKFTNPWVLPVKALVVMTVSAFCVTPD